MRRGSVAADGRSDGKRRRLASVEQELWDAGHEVVVGIDEVGRGAWAGPLMVGAAVLPRDRRVNGVRDSKMLTEGERERLFDRIAGVVRGVGGRGAPARRSATSSAWPRRSGSPPGGRSTALGVVPDAAVVDGNWDFVVAARRATSSGVIKADARCLSVAAASILAKVVRDREMREHAEHYPNWSFDTNKGYPCPIHKAALQGYGPSAIHRRTWVFMDHYVPWPGIQRVRRPDPDARHRCSTTRRRAVVSASRALEGAGEVGDEVVGRLDADRQAHEVVGHLERRAGRRGVGHRRRVLDQALDRAERLGEREQLGRRGDRAWPPRRRRAA